MVFYLIRIDNPLLIVPYKTTKLRVKMFFKAVKDKSIRIELDEEESPQPPFYTFFDPENHVNLISEIYWYN